MPSFSLPGFLAAFLDLLGHPWILIAVLVTAVSVGLRLALLAEAARSEARDYLQAAYLRAQREHLARLEKKMAVAETVPTRAECACGITETGIVLSHDLPKLEHDDDAA